MKDYFEDITCGKLKLVSGKEAVLNLFKDWKGSSGQAFAYQISHSQLLIRYHRYESAGSGFLLFVKDCYEVKFKDSWKNENLTIDETEGEYGTEYIIKDADNLYIRSGVRPFAFVEDHQIYIKENLEQEDTFRLNNSN